MKIEVFGPGCPKCQELEKLVREVVTVLGVEASIEKVNDIMKIAQAGIMLSPAIKINGKVKCTGRLPKIDEVKKWIEEER
jgi:small redox-active disulfide protein 2